LQETKQFGCHLKLKIAILSV